MFQRRRTLQHGHPLERSGPVGAKLPAGHRLPRRRDRARRAGLYDAAMLKFVRCATRDKYFEPAGQHWRPVEALRRQVHWKVADLLAGVEAGPWDIILWRNAAIYLKPGPAETIWRRLASVLAPEGVLIAGKAERPPRDAGLTHAARCIYRRSRMKYREQRSAPGLPWGW